MNCGEFKEQVMAYAVGALDERERRGLEAHLGAAATHEGCEAALREANDAASLLALGLKPERPSPATWTAIERRVGGMAQAPRRSRLGWVGWVVAAAAIVLVVWLVRDREQLIARLGAATVDLEHAQKEVRLEREALALLERPGTKLVPLAPQGATDGRASVIFAPGEGRAYVVATGLTPQSEKDYELWVIRGDKKIPAGLLQAGASGRLAQPIDPALLAGGPPDAIAITVERAGGRPQPEGPIILVGKI